MWLALDIHGGPLLMDWRTRWWWSPFIAPIEGLLLPPPPLSHGAVATGPCVEHRGSSRAAVTPFVAPPHCWSVTIIRYSVLFCSHRNCILDSHCGAEGKVAGGKFDGHNVARSGFDGQRAGGIPLHSRMGESLATMAAVMCGVSHSRKREDSRGGAWLLQSWRARRSCTTPLLELQAPWQLCVSQWKEDGTRAFPFFPLWVFLLASILSLY